MHSHLLSDNEREMLTDYLRTGKGSDTFRVLKFRILRNYNTLTKEFDLITKAKETFKV
jgi:hypothetical protein